MSTIPLTFNQQQISKTVLGGTEESANILMPVSCIVIKRAINQYRNRIFKNLAACGFEKIISVEHYNQNSNMEQLSLEFPEIRFISVRDEVTDECLVNLGMEEVESPYALVLHDDFCVEDFRFNESLAQKLIDFDIFCVCPRLMTKNRQGLPVRFTPKVDGDSFAVESSLAIIDRAASLYPFDGSCFFDTKKFKLLGGYDYTIQAAYWQKADFFFRAWLWGEKTLLSSAFVLSYFDDVPADNQTADISYIKFYLKNLLPDFKNDHCEISTASFISFKARSQCGMNEAMKLFGSAKQWVKKNQYRFKTDAVSLMQNWDKEGEE